MEKTVSKNVCKECNGTGKYVGLWLDVGPCQVCHGSGVVPIRAAAKSKVQSSCSHPAPEPKPAPAPARSAKIKRNIDLNDLWKKMFHAPA